MKHNVYVISADRYQNLPFNEKQKANYVFCVKKGQLKLYQQVGCKNVYETGSLMQSRNFALEHAFAENKMCVQLSDDLKHIKRNKNFGNPDKLETDFVVQDIVTLFAKTQGVKLLGVPPTDNHFFAKKQVLENGFCVGDALFVKPSKPRFDEKLTLKEDYDFTLQHIDAYGICLRYQRYLWTFKHYTNQGGAVGYRTESEELRNINYLRAKWGIKIKLNPKRKNEILI